MTVLTYRFLGERAAQLTGQPLGADAIGWPWRVEAVEHVYDIDRARTQTLVTVEPWPIPGPGDDAGREALATAQRAVLAGRMPEVPA